MTNEQIDNIVYNVTNGYHAWKRELIREVIISKDFDSYLVKRGIKNVK